MGRQEDWEELEKWQKEQEKQEIKEYGADLEQFRFQKKRKKTLAIAKVMDKFFWAVCYGILGILIIIAILAVFYSVNSWKTKTRISVSDLIAKRYGIQVMNLSPEKEMGEKGIYQLKQKEEPEIEFHARKERIRTVDDYEACCHKYFFEQWQSKVKEQFSVVEKYEDGLLVYETDIILKKDEERDSAEEAIQQFIRFAGKWYSENWKIEIR